MWPARSASHSSDAVDALRLAGDDDLVRDERDDRDRQRATLVFARTPGEGSAVVLREERRDDLLVGNLGLLDRVRPDVGELSCADVEERDLDELSLAVEAEDVAVDVVDRDDTLLLAHLLDRAELVAVHGGELEAHLARGSSHLGFELARQLVVAAFEELRDGVDLLAVPGAVDRQDARRRAALDLVLEARTLATCELRVAASPKLKVLVDEMQRSPRRGRRVVRAEVTRSLRRRPPHHFEPWPRRGAAGGIAASPRADGRTVRRFVERAQPQRDEVLVVAELDVVARPVLLDEVVLEDRRLLFVAGDDGLEIADRALQDRNERAAVALRVLKVRTHARAQGLGLADVDDGALLSLKR